MADGRDFHDNKTKAEEALYRASVVLNDIAPGDLAPAERIAYAQVQSTIGVGRALLAQVAQQDQPPLPER
jgi:hypothetical protein